MADLSGSSALCQEAEEEDSSGVDASAREGKEEDESGFVPPGLHSKFNSSGLEFLKSSFLRHVHEILEQGIPDGEREREREREHGRICYSTIYSYPFSSALFARLFAASLAFASSTALSAAFATRRRTQRRRYFKILLVRPQMSPTGRKRPDLRYDTIRRNWTFVLQIDPGHFK